MEVGEEDLGEKEEVVEVEEEGEKRSADAETKTDKNVGDLIKARRPTGMASATDA